MFPLLYVHKEQCSYYNQISIRKTNGGYSDSMYETLKGTRL